MCLFFSKKSKKIESSEEILTAAAYVHTCQISLVHTSSVFTLNCLFIWDGLFHLRYTVCQTNWLRFFYLFYIILANKTKWRTYAYILRALIEQAANFQSILESIVCKLLLDFFKCLFYRSLSAYSTTLGCMASNWWAIFEIMLSLLY